MCQYSTCHTIKDSWVPLSQQQWNINSSFTISGTLCPPPFPILGFVWFSLWRSCACCESLCEFLCTSSWLCLYNILSLKSSTSSGYYYLSPPIQRVLSCASEFKRAPYFLFYHFQGIKPYVEALGLFGGGFYSGEATWRQFHSSRCRHPVSPAIFVEDGILVCVFLASLWTTRYP